MEIHSIMALVVATAILGLVPGPVVAALVGRALFGGFQRTYGFLAGVFFADLIWLLAAVSGLGFVAQTYSTVFLWIKYLGALYLIYLGLQALYAAFKKQGSVSIDERQATSKGNGFVTGLFVTLGNPKLVAFYISFLPTFIDVQALSFSGTLLAALLVPTTFLIMNAGWAYSAAKARQLFKSSMALRILNGISGGLLVGAGSVMLRQDNG